MRHTLRLFTRTPLATAAALGALTLAIGASTLVFSVVNGVLLRDLPYRDPSSLAVDLGDQPAAREHDQRRLPGQLPLLARSAARLRRSRRRLADVQSHGQRRRPHAGNGSAAGR